MSGEMKFCHKKNVPNGEYFSLHDDFTENFILEMNFITYLFLSLFINYNKYILL